MRTKLSALVCTAVAILILGPSTTALAVPLVWVPAGLNPGDPYHLAYTTSTKTTALSTDINTYNAFVDGAMGAIDDASPYGDITWSAIASTDVVNANANAVVSAPVYDLLGNLVATEYSDFWGGSHSAAIDTDELGNTGLDVNTWTGSTTIGTVGGYAGGLGTANCGIGRSGKVDFEWIMYASWVPTLEWQMYGLSEELSAVPEPSSFALAALGLVGMGWFGFRLRKG